MSYSLSIGSAAFGDMSFNGALKQISDSGFSRMDWQLDSTLLMNSDVDLSRIEDIADKLERAGISISCVSNVRDVELLTGPHTAHTDSVCAGDASAKQSHALRHATHALEVARRLNSDFVRFYFGCADHLLLFPWHGHRKSFSANVDDIVDAAEPLFAVARASGITICVEPHPRQAIFRVRDFVLARDVLAQRGFRLGLCFDPANLLAGGLSPVEWLVHLDAAPEIVHLKDISVWRRSQEPLGNGWRRYGPGPEVRFRALGDGELLWPEIRDVLFGLNFEGELVLEFEDVTVDRAWGLRMGKQRADDLFGHSRSGEQWW